MTVTSHKKKVVSMVFIITANFTEHVCADNPPAHQVLDEVVAEVVAKSPDIPLSRQEDKLATSLVCRKLAHGSENGIVHFKTGGQVTSKCHIDAVLSCMLRKYNSPSP